MKWPEIQDRLDSIDQEGWSALWWPKCAGGRTTFRAREVRERREDNRVRILIHADDQNLIGCDQVELVQSSDDPEQIYFVRDVPTEFVDEPDPVL